MSYLDTMIVLAIVVGIPVLIGVIGTIYEWRWIERWDHWIRTH